MRSIMLLMVCCVLTSVVAAGDAFEPTTPGLAGTGGHVPQLAGSGPLQVGSTGNALLANDGLPGAVTYVVFGASELAGSFKGGIMGPSPDIALPAGTLDASGAWSLLFEVPADRPVGAMGWVQLWIQDPSAHAGWAATNTLKLTVQPTCAGFGPPTPSLVGDAPRSIAHGDLDEDGDLDLLVANRDANTVSVMLGDGAGAFALHDTQSVPDWPRGVRLVDLNGDAHLDALVACRSGNAVVVLQGDGAAALTPIQTLAIPGAAPVDTAVVDLEGDGDLDLLIVNNAGASLSVARFEPVMGFVLEPQLTTGSLPRAVRVADLDADGWADAAVACEGPGRVSIHWGGPGGTLSAFDPHPAGNGTFWLALADVDGDGDHDVAAVNWLDDELVVLRNEGNRDFVLSQTLPVGDGPLYVEAADLDGDGDIDLVTANQDSDDLSLLLGEGDGSFTTGGTLSTGERLFAVRALDADGDCCPDLVTADSDDDTVSVLVAGS